MGANCCAKGEANEDYKLILHKPKVYVKTLFFLAQKTTFLAYKSNALGHCACESCSFHIQKLASIVIFTVQLLCMTQRKKLIEIP